jgi:hypothetical protein
MPFFGILIRRNRMDSDVLRSGQLFANSLVFSSSCEDTSYLNRMVRACLFTQQLSALVDFPIKCSQFAAWNPTLNRSVNTSEFFTGFCRWAFGRFRHLVSMMLEETGVNDRRKSFACPRWSVPRDFGALLSVFGRNFANLSKFQTTNSRSNYSSCLRAPGNFIY